MTEKGAKMVDSSYPVITPVYQFYADYPWRWNYSTNPDDGTTQGWTRDHLAFFAFGQSQPGVVPVYLYYAESPWKPQFSLRNDQPPGPGWNYGWVAFYAFKNQTPNAMAVYGYRTSDWRYLYSTNGSLSEPGWTLDGVVFYTFGANPA